MKLQRYYRALFLIREVWLNVYNLSAFTLYVFRLNHDSVSKCDVFVFVINNFKAKLINKRRTRKIVASSRLAASIPTNDKVYNINVCTILLRNTTIECDIISLFLPPSNRKNFTLVHNVDVFTKDFLQIYINIIFTLYVLKWTLNGGKNFYN